MEQLMPYQEQFHSHMEQEIVRIRTLFVRHQAAHNTVAPLFWNGEPPAQFTCVGQQLQMADTISPQDQLDLDAIFRRAHELRREREIQYQDEWSRTFVAGPTCSQVQSVNDLGIHPLRGHDTGPVRNPCGRWPHDWRTLHHDHSTRM